MTFWIVAIGLALVAGVTLAMQLLVARKDDAPAASYDLRVYRDQLKEIDRDLERGVLSAEDAERVRAEVSRRILAADAKMQVNDDSLSKSGTGTTVIAALVVCAPVLGSFALYSSLGSPGLGDLPRADRIAQAEEARANRPSQDTAESETPPYEPPSDSGSLEFMALIDQLRDVVAARPDDVRGHLLLAQNEARLGNFRAAREAQARVIDLKGEAADGQDYANLADMMFWAAGGYISPEAEDALEQAILLDQTNGTARYYLALMLKQTGRPDRAFNMWQQLLREGPVEAPWIAPIEAQIEEVAYQAGVNYAPITVGSGARGPSRADIDAASGLSPSERMEMIEGMVGGLAERLSKEGGTPREWAQLITALGVLGRTSEAVEILAEAQNLFAGNPSAMDALAQAADRAGIAQ